MHHALRTIEKRATCEPASLQTHSTDMGQQAERYWQPADWRRMFCREDECLLTRGKLGSIVGFVVRIAKRRSPLPSSACHILQAAVDVPLDSVWVDRHPNHQEVEKFPATTSSLGDASWRTTWSGPGRGVSEEDLQAL